MGAFGLVAEVGFFIALHRRIVVCRRLDASLTLGSAYSLRLAVSLRQKQHSVVFALLPTTSSVGRGRGQLTTEPKRKTNPIGLVFFLCKGYKKDIFGRVLTGFELYEIDRSFMFKLYYLSITHLP